MKATLDMMGIREFAGIIDTAARHLGEGTANITEEGITLKGMNKAHVVYIETVIYSTFFTEYQADAEEHAGLDYEELAPIIKSITSADEATLTITEGMVRVDAEEHGGTIRSFHLPTLTYEYATPERPNIEYEEYVDIPISVLESALRDATLIRKITSSETLRIRTTEDHIIFCTTDSYAGFRVEYLHGCRVTKPQTSKYTLEHLQGIIPSITDTVSLGFQSDSPLHLKARGEGVDFEALIAPRIITE